MALPFAYRPYTPPKVQGQATQDALIRSLSSAAPPSQPPFTYPTPTSNPYDTSFGQAPGEASGRGVPGSGDLPGPGVFGGGGAGLPSTAPRPLTSSVAAQGSASNSASNGASNGGSSGGIDFESDPILAKIRALNAQRIADAEAGALSARKQGLIGYGYDPSLQSLYPDQSTAEAARQNPFSTLAQLLFGHNQRSDQLTEGLNKANLFYSGERIKQTGLEGRQYTLEQSNANNALQNLLGQIAQTVLQAKQSAQDRELQGEEDAYNRELQFALANGIGYPGGGGRGGAEDATAAQVGGTRTVNDGGTVTAHSQSDLPAGAGWGVTWTGPGVYAAVKFPPTIPGGGSDTRWVKIG